jgi:hypothetical protein
VPQSVPRAEHLRCPFLRVVRQVQKERSVHFLPLHIKWIHIRKDRHAPLSKLEVNHRNRFTPAGIHHQDILQENGLFLSFPYVCPEPVLVKCSLLCING